MEKMKSNRIPVTDSIEELAKFWDTHDLTDFEDQMKEVGPPVFERRKENTVAVALSRKEAEELRRIAEAEGVKETKLVQAWVRERLRSSLKKPPNKPLQPPSQKTRRG